MDALPAGRAFVAASLPITWYRSPMLAHEIGRALRAARKRVGISIQQLGEVTAIDSSLLSSLERGEQLVSTAKLDRLAATLGIDAFALYGGQDVERGLVLLPRQATRPDFQHDDLPILRRALERATALREISTILHRKSLAADFVPLVPGADPAQDGYHLARRVRVALGLITQPLPNLQELFAAEFDIPVISEALATRSLWAAAVRSPASRAVAVVLNTSVPDGPAPLSSQACLVDRVSICHELCHALFDEPKGDGVDVILDDAPREGQEKSAIEQRAGAFAAEMLIPLHGLRTLLGQEGNEASTATHAERIVDQVRVHFGTPGEIAVNHLYNHGYVARVSDFREHLIERVKERGLNQQTSIQFVNDVDAWRRVLISRTRQAHDADMITDGSARAVLELPAGEPLPWENDGQ